MHKVSVIVPVHNASKTLNRCIDSIINQTYSNLEIILTENGSQDCSLHICENYAKNDNRIKVVSLQESGISKARNAGLKCKTGNYFTFVDSDDFIEPDMVEKLLIEAEKFQADLTFCRINNIKSNGEIFVSKEKQLEKVIFENNIQYLFYLQTDNYVRNVIWRILYKSDKFGGLRFNEDMNYAEDADFLYRALPISSKNSLVDAPLYNYIYFYDNSEHIFNKYFSEVDSILKTYKCLATSSYDLCKKFNLDEFAEAAVYSKYVALVNKLLRHPNYHKQIRLINKDEFWQKINTKSKYKAFNKYFSRQSKIGAFLIRHKLFVLYKILLKARRLLSKN